MKKSIFAGIKMYRGQDICMEGVSEIRRKIESKIPLVLMLWTVQGQMAYFNLLLLIAL